MFYGTPLGDGAVTSGAWLDALAIRPNSSKTINPQCMHRRVTVVVLSVCYHEICCIPCLYIENKVSWGSLWCFQGFCCVAFAENAFFFKALA